MEVVINGVAYAPVTKQRSGYKATLRLQSNAQVLE